MGRILVCGLNGVGKSTVGKLLAKRLHDVFWDIEDIYFPKNDPDDIYGAARSQEEVSRILLDILATEENLVLSAVTGKYVPDFEQYFDHCVLLEATPDVRTARVQKRSLDRFGARAQAGGDLFEREQRFLSFVKNKKESLVEEWLQTVHVPAIRINGEKTPDAIVEDIIKALPR